MRIAASIAQIDNHESLTHSVSESHVGKELLGQLKNQKRRSVTHLVNTNWLPGMQQSEVGTASFQKSWQLLSPQRWSRAHSPSFSQWPCLFVSPRFDD